MAVTKTTTERVLELMKEPENIRNICTSAHIDHGKCVAPKTRILLADGAIISAEQLHSIVEQRGKKVFEDENKVVYDATFCDINILSLNKETGKVEKKPISHSWKLKGGEVISVKLRNGACITTTPEHKYLVLEALDFKEKQAREIKLGDRIVCARKALPKSKLNVKKDILRMQEEIIEANSNQVFVSRFGGAVMQLQKQRGDVSKYKRLTTGDLSYIEVKSIELGYEPLVYDFSVLDNKNFVAEGMIIHNTTFSDNLLAGAGMISEQLAGTQLVLDFDPQESARGITINAANVSMVHNLHNKDYLVNLIDTPGHVDFGGEVTKAMRAVDGTIVLVCAVEGIMPQTEAVVRQALKERVKPVLFINKVDRLIRELKLTPEQMLERFTKIINDVNKLIKNLAPEEYKEKWLVNVQDGSVSFGSAYHRWALNIPYMKEKGISLKDIIDGYTKDEESWKKLGSRAPLHEAVLTMVIKHLPNPKQAQAYRVPKLWHGDLESSTGRALIACDANGPPVFVITKITTDQQAGEVATGRIFSGKLVRGQDLYLVNAKEKQKAQQLSVYRGAQRVIIEEAYPGNIVGVIGLKSATSGETCALEPIEPFEKIKHIFEAVVTKAIEAKNPKDLPDLIEALRQIAKEDTTLKVEINHETGEHLLSGLGELHLEIWEYRLRNNYKIDIVTSPPVVVYRESITRASGGEMEGKSPNKHNKLYVIIEPLSQQLTEAILSGEIPEIRVKKKDKEFENKFVALGMDKDEAKQIVEVFKGNILEDTTRGQIHMGEIIELVMDAFEEMMKASPLAKEPAIGLKVKLVDAKLHEDSIHRGPAQIIPAMRQAMANSLLVAGISLQEPIQEIRIDVPADYFGNVTKLISGRRGQLLETQQEGDYIVVKAKMPVGEMFGFTTDLRAATTGRGSWFLVGQDYQSMPRELQTEVVMKIRQRKGLPKELPKPEFD